MKHCYIILTDSGGIQEEAAALGKPTLVMRKETERIEAGVVKLIGSQFEEITKNVEILLDDKKIYTKMAKLKFPYGKGDTAKKIVKILLKDFNLF